MIDPITFNIEQLPLTVTLPENGAALLIPSDEEVQIEGELQEYELVFQNAKVQFENNYLTMDVMRYSEDGVHYSEPIMRGKLFQLLLEKRYEGKLWLKYEFHISVIPEKLTLVAEDAGVLLGCVNGRAIQFEGNCDAEPTLRFADITAFVSEGNNFYETVLDWRQNEKTYYALFGENVTESLRNCVEYESEIAAAYLMGPFGVYSMDGFETHDEETVCAHQFTIGESPTYLSEPVLEGLPFFRGKLIMEEMINFSDKAISLKLAGRYVAANVWVNGKTAGKLLFDKSLDISQYVVKGENQIKVEFIIGNRNFLGPFHYEGKEDGVSPGVFATCNLPNTKEGHPRYKFYLFYQKKMRGRKS